MKNAHFEFLSFSSKGIWGKMGVGAINSEKRERGKSWGGESFSIVPPFLGKCGKKGGKEGV